MERARHALPLPWMGPFLGRVQWRGKWLPWREEVLWLAPWGRACGQWRPRWGSPLEKL